MTEMVTVAATFAGTSAVIVVLLITVKLVAAMPPNATAVVPVKFVPVIVTIVPAGPVVGANDVMVCVGVQEVVVTAISLLFPDVQFPLDALTR